MIGAGAAGAVCGLSGGLIISLLQLLSGETVEERWRKEFKLIEVFFIFLCCNFHTSHIFLLSGKEKSERGSHS